VPQAGIFLLDVVGEDRFEIIDSKIEKSGLRRATVRWIPAEKKVVLPNTYAELRAILSEVMERAGDNKFAEPYEMNDSTWVGSRLVEILQLPPAIKQTLLEINDAELRLKTLYQLINRISNAASMPPTSQAS
jgi:uncharacterized protein